MSNLPVRYRPAAGPLAGRPADALPAIVAEAGDNARFAYEEFFTGLDSPHTITAYRRDLHQFLAHVHELGLALHQVTPKLVRAYIDPLRPAKATEEPLSAPTRKRVLAALRKFFDYAVTRHAVLLAGLSVRGISGPLQLICGDHSAWPASRHRAGLAPARWSETGRVALNPQTSCNGPLGTTRFAARHRRPASSRPAGLTLRSEPGGSAAGRPAGEPDRRTAAEPAAEPPGSVRLARDCGRPDCANRLRTAGLIVAGGGG